ncbi:hypothetical protein Tco_0002983 [Tanacetum coccineum]
MTFRDAVFGEMFESIDGIASQAYIKPTIVRGFRMVTRFLRHAIYTALASGHKDDNDLIKSYLGMRCMISMNHCYVMVRMYAEVAIMLINAMQVWIDYLSYGLSSDVQSNKGKALVKA